MIEWIWLFLQIMLINIVLSGDNAVVIALASKSLPPKERKLAVWWGAFGAIALRVVLTLIAVALLDLPFIQGGGAVLLIWIAIKLLTEEEGQAQVKEAATLSKAISTIILADFVMSLDNVLAIAAKAENDTAIIILGIALSVPIIIWGSTMVMKLLHRFPFLIYLGAALLGYTAGEMLLKEPKLAILWELHANIHILVPLFATMLVVAAGLLVQLFRRPTHYA